MNNFSKLNNIFKQDITFKILAVLFAIALWYLVNPVKTVNIEVPLTVINEGTLNSRNLRLTDRNFVHNVVVKVRGREDKLKNLNSTSFQAVLDLADISSVTDKLVYIDGPSGVRDGISIVDMSPKVVEVKLASVISDTFAVEVETTGTPKAGYRIVSRTVSPEQIVIIGVDSDIRNVGKIKVVADVSGIDKNTGYEKLGITVLDKKGNEIPELGKDRFVDVSVEVAKEVPVKLVTRGTFDEDVIGTVKGVNPEKVLITGDYEVVSKITEIETEPVDISKVTRTTELDAVLDIPDGTKLYGTSKKIKVIVEAEQLVKREVVLPRENISIGGSDDTMITSIVTPEIRITIKGRNALLSGLSSDDLIASVDVSGLGEGSHQVPVSISVPNNLELIGQYKVEVSIQKPSEEET